MTVIFARIHVRTSVVLCDVCMGSQCLEEGHSHEHMNPFCLVGRLGGDLSDFFFFFFKSICAFYQACWHALHCISSTILTHTGNWKSMRYRLGASFLLFVLQSFAWMCGRRLERRCPCSSSSSSRTCSCSSSIGLSGKQASRREYTFSLQELGFV